MSSVLAVLGAAAATAGVPRLAIEPNVGQADAKVRFVAYVAGGSIRFMHSGLSLSTSRGGSPTPEDLEIQFLGARPDAVIRGQGELSGKVHYLVGHDPARWRRGVATYAGVTYTGLYAGIDLSYEGDRRGLKATFTVHPGSSPAAIRWRYREAGVAVDPAGALRIDPCASARGATTEPAPVAWQDVGGRRMPVASRYVIERDGAVGYALGSYDPALPLTIDPSLTYATYFGGSIADQPWGMATDAQGNSFVVGYTASGDFPAIDAEQPVAGGQGDAFVVKFDRNGTPLFSTYLGGWYVDMAYGVAVDGYGDVYVTGWTGSSDFPTVGALQPSYAGGWDAFVTKLSADGSTLLHSTYLGGSSADSAHGIAVDAAGTAYVCGTTQSADFPSYRALQPQHSNTGTTDAFVTALAFGGQSLVYSTYLGGSLGGESALAIAADAGNAYVTGYTTARNFPTANPSQASCAPGAAGCWDAFVTKLAPGGQGLVYSTFLGGNDQESVDQGRAITTDGTGVAYVTGATGSPNFPILAAYQPGYGGQIDVFVTSFASGGSLRSSTFLGGYDADVGNAITLDYLDNVFVGGLTLSPDFPVVSAVQPSMGGFEDAFVTKFAPGVQSLRYSTYLGGSNDREEYGIVGIGVDGTGTAYLAGSTSATDFPTVTPYQSANRGSYDLFFAEIADPQCVPGPPVPDFTGTPRSGVAPLAVSFTDLSANAPTAWWWSFGDGGTSAARSPSHTYSAPGTYAVSLEARNACGSAVVTKAAFVIVTGSAIDDEIVTGAGAGPSNAPVVKTWDHGNPPGAVSTFSAYGSPQYGCNVASVDIEGGGPWEVVTGPGPGAIYGPQVRGFQPTGTPIAKVSFYAYGTLRFGVHTAGGNVDGDAHGEPVTSPGPGAVFGPHVRGFDYDGASLTAIGKISFFAYSTLRYGARTAGGDVDGDGFAEILTGAGGGAPFGPHVRGFDYDGAGVAALPISLFAFASGQYGADVGAGRADGAPDDVILASHGPDPSSGGEVAGFDFTGTAAVRTFDFDAFPGLGGAEVASGDLDADGSDEVVVGAGWGTASASSARAFTISGGNEVLILSFPAYPAQTYGTKVTAGNTGI